MAFFAGLTIGAFLGFSAASMFPLGIAVGHILWKLKSKESGGFEEDPYD